jgi:hypothetical protein
VLLIAASLVPLFRCSGKPHGRECSVGFYALSREERQIPFDADKSIGWSESATEKKSVSAEVNSPTTWNALVWRGCRQDETSIVRTYLDVAASDFGTAGRNRFLSSS